MIRLSPLWGQGWRSQGLADSAIELWDLSFDLLEAVIAGD